MMQNSPDNSVLVVFLVHLFFFFFYVFGRKYKAKMYYFSFVIRLSNASNVTINHNYNV